MAQPIDDDGSRGPTLAGVEALRRLSTREEQVLSLAAEGLVDKQIAATLGLTLNTLRTYWSRIRGKLGEAPRSALVALYATERAQSNLDPFDGIEWTVDLERRVFAYHGLRGLFPEGDTPIERVLAAYHPDDRPGVTALLRAFERGDVPPLVYRARLLTPHGVELATSYVEAVRDETDRVVKIVGRHVPIVDLTAPAPGGARVGVCRHDLETGVVTLDEGIRAIFRISSDDGDPMRTLVARFCPEFRERIQTLFENLVEAGADRRRWAARLCFEDGTNLWISAGSRLEYRRARPTAFVATMIAYR